MKLSYDLSCLPWTVEGYTPYVWQFERMYGVGFGADARCLDVPPIPARVPGSVQGALRAAGILPDWNIGLNWRACEWVEHRHWMYRVHLPDEWLIPSASFRLECLGLDYSGWVIVNRVEVAAFKGTHIPHIFDLTSYLHPTGNVVEIVFDLPPRWLGEFGFTSQMTDWKPRFNYTWDWSPRLVQIGIWDAITLVAVQGSEIRDMHCTADADLNTGAGVLELSGSISACESQLVRVSLTQEHTIIRGGVFTTTEFTNGVRWDDLPVELWWPNLSGDQPLYTLTVQLVNAESQEQDRRELRVGFKHIDWLPCEAAPPAADPWLCAVNGRPIFLQGVNFAPLSPNFADLRQEDYAVRLRQYRDLGCNTLRINACQFLEREWFYDLCDEFGLLVWQELPLTSSGIDNWPPEDEASLAAMTGIASSFIERRRHHVSLLLWSGGNELQGDFEGHKTGIGKPCDLTHPLLMRLSEVAQALDPTHRFIPTSPGGPRAGAAAPDFGKGVHWDVHGGAAMSPLAEAQAYWSADDALFRSEIYCPGASPLETIRKYAGELPLFPPTSDNPYWARLTTWWLDWRRLIAIHGREPYDLEEYIAWSQANQAQMLALEIQSCKVRFPRCGGVLLWSGHDTFPLAINSSLIDYDGNLKPAALSVAQVWHAPTGQ